MTMNKAVPRPAATCVMLQETGAGLELLLTKRHSGMSSFAGMWVFPGGVFDPEDYENTPSNTANLELESVGKRAAAREVAEETGIKLSADSLKLFSHWTTPAQLPKRWATWFYLAMLTKRPQLTLEAAEVEEALWLSAADALEQQAAGLLPMSPPTLITLNQLAGFNSFADIEEFLTEHRVDYVEPKMIRDERGSWIVQPDDVAFSSGELDQAGHRDRILISKAGLQQVRD